MIVVSFRAGPPKNRKALPNFRKALVMIIPLNLPIYPQPPKGGELFSS
jgi:hypothetical protein